MNSKRHSQFLKCGFCGYEFDPASAEQSCNGCPVLSNCRLVRCPRCGYEMPPESMLITWARKLIRRSQSETTTSTIPSSEPERAEVERFNCEKITR